MAQKLFLTGPGSLRRAERKEAIDGLVEHPAIVYSKSEIYLYGIHSHTMSPVSFFSRKICNNFWEGSTLLL